MANLLGMVTTTPASLPGRTAAIPFTVAASAGADADGYVAQIATDAAHPAFHEGDAKDDASGVTMAECPS